MLEERLEKYKDIENSSKLAFGDAAEMASLLWESMRLGGITTTQTWENQAILLEKIMNINGEKTIGRWTAARVFQQYIVLRFDSYYLEMMAQIHKERDQVKSSDDLLSSEEHLRIFEMLDYDIRNVKAWAYSLQGFEYPNQTDATKNCSGHLHNDLLWEPWEV